MAQQYSFVVVGGGLAGLMATIKLAEAGHHVDLISLTPVRRSHSACAQGGINGAVNIKGENDSPEIHFYDTVKGGDFLADQPLAKGMCYAAPDIIYLLDRMGVTFNRTPEGNLDFRRFGGTLYHRTAFAGATTGQQMLYALDEQVRRWEDAGLVSKYEHHDFLAPVLDDAGVCHGIVAQDTWDMKTMVFKGDAVLLASGGLGGIYRQSTNSVLGTGSAAAGAYLAGAKYANPEMIQVHPTAIPGEDKLRLMSESARGEGGRVWVPRKSGDTRDPKDIPENERWYFLEEKYPTFGNLVPRDIASREIYDICVNQGKGIGGQLMVYLDLTHIPAETLDRKLGGILEIYERFKGVDPRYEPMRIFPAMHYSMGGLWVGYEADAEGMPIVGSPKNQQTSIPGLYAAGEVDCQYHGANRLGANSLLSCIYGGMLAGPSMVSYASGMEKDAGETSSAVFEREQKRWDERFVAIRAMNGTENPYQLHHELGKLMVENVTIVRYNDRLKATDQKLQELQERWNNLNVLDTQMWANQALSFAHWLENMLKMARIITLGALARDESRGAHFKPDFPQRDDANWLKTTLVEHTPGGPKFSYIPVDTSLAKPVARHYD